jgi:hypothetical protein
MAVTKQTYTATATWTAAQLATIFESAFIDAGLMTAWYDNFLNTVENRILEVQYDNTKTYGKTYYWFQFTTAGVFLSVATGWNATTHVPTGTQYLDYFATTTNVTTNHATLVSLVNTTTTTLTRYTSGVTSSFSWFVVRNGTTSYNLHIPSASVGRVTWMDLDKVLFHPVLKAVASINNQGGWAEFQNICTATRRSYLAQGSLRGNTSATDYGAGTSVYHKISPYRYMGWGNTTIGSNNALDQTVLRTGTIPLPTGFNNANPAYTTDVIPVFTGLNYWAHLTSAMPSDFGVSFHYANNTMAIQDKLIVTASTEEWEMLAVTNNAIITTGASPMFLARVV